MDLNLDVPQGQHFIRSVDASGIRIDDTYYHDSLIVSGTHIVPAWEAKSFHDINKDNLQIIFDMQPELVLIGCGKTQEFLPPALQMLFLGRDIGVEVMVTAAACRTFNLLAGDGRQVVAALLWDNR